VTADQAHEVAELGFVLPEAAAPLILAALDRDPGRQELRSRARQALCWLDASPDAVQPIEARAGDTPTESMCFGIATALVSVLTTAGKQDRSRLGGLLQALLREVERLAAEPRERAA
jgi:hypothetical protein